MEEQTEGKSSEQKLASAEQEFVDFVVRQEINRDNIIEAWKLFQQYICAKLGQDEDLFVNEVIKVLTTKESTERYLIEGAQFAFHSATGSFGQVSLFKNLDKESLEKALDFREAMSKVGWRTGDLEEEFPL